MQVAVDEWGVHSRGGDAVAANVVVDVVASYRIGHRQHRAFAHAVGEAIGEPSESRNRGEIQNHASPGGFHRIERGGHAVVDALNVDAVNAIKFLFRRIFQLPDMGYAGIVHEDIDGACPCNSPENIFDLLLIRDIAGCPLSSSSRVTNLLRRLLCVLLIDFNDVD